MKKEQETILKRTTTNPTLIADPFVFLFSHSHFLKTNAEHSRAPLKNKLHKRVILSYPAWAHWLLPLPANQTLGQRKTIFTNIKINCRTAA